MLIMTYVVMFDMKCCADRPVIVGSLVFIWLVSISIALIVVSSKYGKYKIIFYKQEKGVSEPFYANCHTSLILMADS